MKVELTTREVEAVNKALSRSNASEVLVKIEHGKVVVLLVEKKKVQ